LCYKLSFKISKWYIFTKSYFTSILDVVKNLIMTTYLTRAFYRDRIPWQRGVFYWQSIYLDKTNMMVLQRQNFIRLDNQSLSVKLNILKLSIKCFGIYCLFFLWNSHAEYRSREYFVWQNVSLIFIEVCCYLSISWMTKNHGSWFCSKCHSRNYQAINFHNNRNIFPTKFSLLCMKRN